MAAAEAGTAAAVTAAKIGAAASAASAATNAAVSMSGGHSARKSARKIAREQMAFNADQAEKANRFNAEQAQIARQWQEDYYNKYESVGSQMRQRMEAGYNPYADASGGSAPSAAVAAPAVVPDSSPLSGASSTISNSIHQQNAEVIQQVQELGSVFQTMLNLQMQSAQINKVEAETDATKAASWKQLFENNVLDMDLSDEDLKSLPGFGFDPSWKTLFESNNKRSPKVGDLLFYALARESAMHQGKDYDESNLDPFNIGLRWSRSGRGSFELEDPTEKDKYLIFGNAPEGNKSTSGWQKMMQQALKSFMFEKDSPYWSVEGEKLSQGIDRIRKNRMENGLDTSPANIVGTLLQVLFASNPDAFKNLVQNVGGNGLDLISNMSNPIGFILKLLNDKIK